jgi:hypothetical protein
MEWNNGFYYSWFCGGFAVSTLMLEADLARSSSIRRLIASTYKKLQINIHGNNCLMRL